MDNFEFTFRIVSIWLKDNVFTAIILQNKLLQITAMTTTNDCASLDWSELFHHQIRFSF